MRLWDSYWAWTGGNIGAMPLQAVISIGFVAVLARPAARAWRRLVGERADIEDMRRAAAAAHKIAADLFEHHTGRPHPDAPAKTESEVA